QVALLKVLMMNVPAWVLKFLKFGLVGATGLVIDFGVTWLCKQKLKQNKFLSNSCGFSLAVTNNYLLNRAWTFSSSHTSFTPAFTKFIIVSIFGLGLNNLLLYFAHSRGRLAFYLSKGMATAVVLAWNFSANYFFTFHT
ncbi:MAG TPA: GtrA family protein, partial [Chitinophagaceae bacterium]|nr:GtrA family protein [Chitinophagaceae bacterium]